MKRVEEEKGGVDNLLRASPFYRSYRRCTNVYLVCKNGKAVATFNNNVIMIEKYPCQRRESLSTT